MFGPLELLWFTFAVGAAFGALTAGCAVWFYRMDKQSTPKAIYNAIIDNALKEACVVGISGVKIFYGE